MLLISCCSIRKLLHHDPFARLEDHAGGEWKHHNV